MTQQIWKLHAGLRNDMSLLAPIESTLKTQGQHIPLYSVDNVCGQFSLFGIPFGYKTVHVTWHGIELEIFPITMYSYKQSA